MRLLPSHTQPPATSMPPSPPRPNTPEPLPPARAHARHVHLSDMAARFVTAVFVLGAVCSCATAARLPPGQLPATKAAPRVLRIIGIGDSLTRGA